jgi:ketosteroid isomerase-like protein
MNASAAFEAHPELRAFLAKVDLAQEAFARGCPDEFKALWSHTEDVTLAGGLGGVIEVGWDRVAARLDWAASNYAEGGRSNQLIGGFVADDMAYVVRKEIIEATIGGGTRSRQELRVTMMFRREAGGWCIVHRHADSQDGRTAVASGTAAA